jgi:hypothetical protein
MIQIQDTRFTYNWQRRANCYPSYAVTKRAFDETYGLFKQFVAQRGLPAPQENQWEVVYVNHIPKSEWGAVEGWRGILSDLYIPAATSPLDAKLDSMSGNWAIRLGDQARLHISLRHGRTRAEEVMVLQLIARGPIGESSLSLDGGHAIGHEAIVRTFLAMTSPESHERWGRESDAT